MEFPSPVQATRGLPVGSLLFERFVVERLIGQGGMGMVVSARDQVLGARVALKLLPDCIRADAAARDALRQETLRTRALSHKSIVRLHDFLDDGTHAAIVMELVEGTNLTDRRLLKPYQLFEYTELLPWLGDLCDALDYAHRDAKLVHRDIKPANLLLSDRDEIKLTDFGVSRQVADSMSRVSAFLGGTLLYMSPEQALGSPPTPADDIYSLGATLYELLCGQPPFYTGDVRLQLEKRKVEPLSARLRAKGVGASGLPKCWEATIMACLEKDPEKRPASAGEIAERLIPSQPASRRPKPARRATPLQRFAPWVLAGALLAGGALWGTRQHRLRTQAIAPIPLGRSETTRAVGAWNLDGDGKDASDNGLDALSTGRSSLLRHAPTPTRDRFGRLDRALHFGGGSGLVVNDHPRLHFSGEDPVAISFWLRPTANTSSAHAELVLVEDLAQTFASMHVRCVENHIEIVRNTPDGDRARVFSSEPLPQHSWTHVLVTSDGRLLRTYLNGRLTGELETDIHTRIPAITNASIRICGGTAYTENHYIGDLDELRLYRHRLSPEDIRRISSPEPSPVFRSTKAVYNDSNDYDAVVKAEFGPEATPADWKDFVRYHSDDVLTLLEEIDLPTETGSPRVVWFGEKHWEGKRSFGLNRMKHKLWPTYEAHGEIGNNLLVLGSWYDARERIVAALPAAKPVSEILLPDNEGRLARNLPPARRRDALGLFCQAGPGGKARLGVDLRLRLRDGREYLASCRQISERELLVSIGNSSRPGHNSVLQQAVAEPVNFELIVRDGRLSFRAAIAVGNNPLFSETVPLPELRCLDIESIQILGTPQAELVQE